MLSTNLIDDSIREVGRVVFVNNRVFIAVGRNVDLKKLSRLSAIKYNSSIEMYN